MNDILLTNIEILTSVAISLIVFIGVLFAFRKSHKHHKTTFFLAFILSIVLLILYMPHCACIGVIEIAKGAAYISLLPIAVYWGIIISVVLVYSNFFKGNKGNAV